MKDTVKELVRRVAVETMVVMASSALITGLKSAYSEWRTKRNQKQQDHKRVS